jgi:aspartate/methionine/tyrosine aminotransferase
MSSPPPTSIATATPGLTVSRRSQSVASFKVMDVLRRANDLQAAGHDVLHCEVGQPETGAPRAVAQAAVEALQQPQVMGYTDAFGLLALRQKIAAHYSKTYATPVDPARIVVTTGSSGGFLLAFTACFDAGDTVAIASAGYPCYRNILGALDCQLAHIRVSYLSNHPSSQHHLPSSSPYHPLTYYEDQCGL